MTKLNVPIDAVTLEEYCLPACKLLNPNEIVERFQTFNLTVRQILPSVLVVLFGQGDVSSAHKLCNVYMIYQTRLCYELILIIVTTSSKIKM